METKDLNTIEFYIVTMVTTIQVSEELVKELKRRKMYAKESYEDIIWDLLEDTMELSDETLKRVEEARKRIEKGEYVTLEQAKKELGL